MQKTNSILQTQTYSTSNLFLNKDILSIYINNFWNDIFNNIKDGNYLMIMVKVNFTDPTEGIKSILEVLTMQIKKLL